MNFSDWITIVSILIAVLLVIIKHDEYEIIKLKIKASKWLLLILIFSFIILIFSGLVSYFNSNPHPQWLDCFWTNNGLPSGVWPIILLTLSIIIFIFFWKKLTHLKPNEELTKKYKDYLLIYEPSKFSSLFRKYEKYILNTDDKYAFSLYEILFTDEKFWFLASTHLKEIIAKEPEKFHEVNEDILKTLLSSQLSSIPNSLITVELNTVSLSDNTPILDIFFSTSYFIEQVDDKNILQPTIKYESNEYFSSLKFLEEEKKHYELKPSDNVWEQIAPKRIIIFYYIKLMDYYWNQVVKTGAKGFPWPAYEHWTKSLLTQAPIVENDFDSDNIPNHYILAVDKMFSNISDWVGKIEKMSKEESKQDVKNKKVLNIERIQDFNDLKIAMLLEIQNNHLSKVSETWLKNKKEYLLKEIIIGKELLKDNYYNEEKIKNKLLQLKIRKSTFYSCTNKHYFGYERKEESETDENYKAWKWLQKFKL